jgi:hypothetical protein
MHTLPPPAAKGKRALKVLKLADSMDELSFDDVMRFLFVIGLVSGRSGCARSPPPPLL